MKDRESFIVTLESLSCGGKGTIGKRVRTDAKLAQVDVVDLPTDRRMKHPTPTHFAENDIKKFEIARSLLGQDDKRIALIDRGWLSTLLFYEVMQQQLGDDFPFQPKAKLNTASTQENLQSQMSDKQCRLILRLKR